MSDPVIKLQILLRAELAIARIRTHRAVNRTIMFGVALLFVLLGVCMLNVAGYQYLSQSLGNAGAALVMAALNTTLGLLVAVAASKAGPGESQQQLAEEMRDLAYGELSQDVDHLQRELAEVASDIRGIRSGIGSAAGGAINTLAPLLSILARMLKSK